MIIQTLRRIALIGMLLASQPAAAVAQSSTSMISRGIQAYRALEYDSAAVLFGRGLAVTGSGAISGSARIDALTYLGATQYLRGDTAAAGAAFVQAVALDPIHRIDSLVFPPSVTRSFEVARFTTAYSSILVPLDTLITAGSQSLRMKLFASAPHDVVVSLLRENGSVAREIFVGRVTDTVGISWNGTDSSGASPLSGSFVLQVRPRSASAMARGSETRIPLTISSLRVDTLITPAQPSAPQTRTQRSATVSGIQSLVLGTLAGATAIFLPEVIGEGGSAMPERYVVGATLGSAGILGFLKARQSARNDMESALAARRFDMWRSASDSVRAENSRRLKSPRLRISAGQPSVRFGAGNGT